MRGEFVVVLDACVLLPMPLADTLLRMAETLRLYLPKWSEEIIAEVSRNVVARWNKTEQQARRRVEVMREHFPEAWVEDYELLIPVMTNEAKDRHVIATAIRGGASLIVTYNAKDFPRSSMEPWGIERQGPSTFLISLYDLEPGIVVRKLSDQAQNVGLSLEQLLSKLHVNAPGFVVHFCEAQGIEFADITPS